MSRCVLVLLPALRCCPERDDTGGCKSPAEPVSIGRHKRRKLIREQSKFWKVMAP